MRIFVDMDGVLADFDRGHHESFGVLPSKLADDVDWQAVRGLRDFYLNLPPMPDMRELWDYVAPFDPIVLTGVPGAVQEAPANKTAWVRKHLGEGIEVRCCKSRDKCLHAEPGDILIDDWEKYRDRWLGVGGRWITHVSAAGSIAQLQALGVR